MSQVIGLWEKLLLNKVEREKNCWPGESFFRVSTSKIIANFFAHLTKRKISLISQKVNYAFKKRPSHFGWFCHHRVHFSKFFSLIFAHKNTKWKINITQWLFKPEKSWGEKCHFQGAVWDFFNFGLCNFFLGPVRWGSTVESHRSREVGLHKKPLVFLYNQPELRYFDRPN